MKIDHKQQGSIVFLMTCMLLVFTLITIVQFHYRLIQWHSLYHHETQYYTMFNHAYSALVWGETLTWTEPKQQWQCKYSPDGLLTVCMKQASRPNLILLKGTNKTVSLYRVGTQKSSDHIEYMPGSWSDFCPETKEADCE